MTESYGPTVGLRLSYALFDGNQRKIKRQNATVERERQQATVDQTTLDLETQLLTTFQSYEHYRQQLRIEQSSLPTYALNFQRTQEDYELGTVTATDLRSAQLNLMNARNRIINLEYDIKMTETTLLRLAGDLVSRD